MTVSTASSYHSIDITHVLLQVHNSSSAFSVEWSWSASPYNVHGFPHIAVESPSFPIQLQHISSLNLKAQFSSYLTSDQSEPPSTRQFAIKSSGVRADIAFDFFADPDPTISFANTTTRPSYEIMIWVWQTQAIYPIGSQTTHWFTIANTSFTLWSGTNPHGTNTFSWLAPVDGDLGYVDADYSPLVHYLWQLGMVPADAYLGRMQFGSETFTSGGEKVTFAVNGWDFGVKGINSSTAAPLVVPSNSSGAAGRVGPVWLVSVSALIVVAGALLS